MKRFFAILLALSMLLSGGAFAESGKGLKGEMFAPEETEAAEQIPADENLTEEAPEAAENAGTGENIPEEAAQGASSEDEIAAAIPAADAELIRRGVQMAEVVVDMSANEGHLALWSATEEERESCKQVAAIAADAPVRAYLAYLGESEQYYAQMMKIMRVSDDLLMVTAREMIDYSVHYIGVENPAEYLLMHETSCAPLANVSESALALLEYANGTLIRVYFERADDGSMFVAASPVWLGDAQTEYLKTGGLTAVLNYTDSAITAKSVSYADESLRWILKDE